MAREGFGERVESRSHGWIRAEEQRSEREKRGKSKMEE